MSDKAFDVIEAISGLLKRIDEGRQTVRHTQSVYDDFRRICANRGRVGDSVDEMQRKMASMDERAKSLARKKLNRTVAEYGKLNDESSRLWHRWNESISFIDPFTKDVAVLAERLPPKPEWDVYREALGCLDVSLPGSWTDPPATSALGSLEMRLREMLDLAIRTHLGKVRHVDPFPTPAGALWKDVSIKFIGDHRVQITVLKVIQTRNNAEMGFEDRRGGGNPDSGWECLRLLAKFQGKIDRPRDLIRPGWSKVEKQIQTVRRRLKELFGIPGDPLPFRHRSCYEAQFEIKLAHSTKH